MLEASGHFQLVRKSLFLQTPVGAPSVRPMGPGRRNARAAGRAPGGVTEICFEKGALGTGCGWGRELEQNSV